MAKHTNRSAQTPELQLLLSSNFTYQLFGVGKVPGATNEFALSQAVQSEASASQIIQSALAKRLKNSTTIYWHLPVTRLTQKLNLKKSYAARENFNRYSDLVSNLRMGISNITIYLCMRKATLLVSWIGRLLVGIQNSGNTLQHCDLCQKTFGGMSFC